MCFFVLLRVGPHQITEDTVKWRFNETVMLVDHLDLSDLWPDAAMHAKIVITNFGSDWKCIKNLHEKVVNLHIVAVKDFLTESETFGHVPRLVITSEKIDNLGKSNFVGEQKKTALNTLNPSVNVVSQEKVTHLIAWIAVLFE